MLRNVFSMKNGLCFLILVFSNFGWAHEETAFVWNDFALKGNLSETWSVGANTSLRHSVDPVEPVQYLIPRVIFNYRINQKHAVGFGYENFVNPIDGNTDRAVFETRNTFQHAYSPGWRWLQVLQTRLELRKNELSPHLWLRTRVFARSVLKDWDEGGRLAFENELFFYLNPDQTPTGETIEGHWHTLVYDKALSEKWSGRVAYMAQWLYREDDDLLAHTWRTGLTYRF